MADLFIPTYLKSRRLERRSMNQALPTLDDLIREYILYVLALTRHNVALSARILRISRTTLYKRINGHPS